MNHGYLIDAISGDVIIGLFHCVKLDPNGNNDVTSFNATTENVSM